MKVSVFAVLLVLYLSVCGAFATHKRTKCRKQKGAAITKGTKITTWNWMSSDPADEKMTWRECKSSCQVDGDCKGWSYQYVFATSVAPFTQSRHLVDPVHPDIQSDRWMTNSCPSLSWFSPLVRRSSRFGGGCSIYSKVKKYTKNYQCMCSAYAGKCK